MSPINIYFPQKTYGLDTMDNLSKSESEKYNTALFKERWETFLSFVWETTHFLPSSVGYDIDTEKGKTWSFCYLALSSANQLVRRAYATPPYKERGNGSTSVVLEEALYLKGTHCHMVLLPRQNWALLGRNDLANALTASARNVNSGSLGWATTHFQITIYSPFFFGLLKEI